MGGTNLREIRQRLFPVIFMGFLLPRPHSGFSGGHEKRLCRNCSIQGPVEIASPGDVVVQLVGHAGPSGSEEAKDRVVDVSVV